MGTSTRKCSACNGIVTPLGVLCQHCQGTGMETYVTCNRCGQPAAFGWVLCDAHKREHLSTFASKAEYITED